MMTIIINSSSQTPMYEQIVGRIKTLIMGGELKSGDMLPSVRSLARELKISALTVKKAYDALEQQGLAVTVQGKGSFVSLEGAAALEEEAMLGVQEVMEKAVAMGRKINMNDDELRRLLDLILEG